MLNDEVVKLPQLSSIGHPCVGVKTHLRQNLSRGVPLPHDGFDLLSDRIKVVHLVFG